ncbi:guanylate kinase domain protein [Teladorsagia circumcincta]|uniref:Guanylate kinase domain protein n=1 Tax=Teladorsagia circumcincta TaxID=45464 RepID=A0A2G9U3H0_TELCI|nr:guanylate kinase domain protein [Teladorsagia circumcincta]
MAMAMTSLQLADQLYVNTEKDVKREREAVKKCGRPKGFRGMIFATGTRVQSTEQIKKAVSDVEQTGKICVLDIELQGVRNIKNTHLNARYILIRTPTLEILESRLRARGTEKEEDIARRLKHAREDLAEVEKDPELFDHIIINDDLERAYKEFIHIIEEDLIMPGLFLFDYVNPKYTVEMLAQKPGAVPPKNPFRFEKVPSEGIRLSDADRFLS